MKLLVVAALLTAQAATPVFGFETDGFWLTLHHFLYVLGHVEPKMPDVAPEAVAGAPVDEADGLKTLSDSERQTWREAVAAYAKVLSRPDAVFDRDLVRITNLLRRTPSRQPLPR